ncbi:sulfite exporter TauE/SafE family protein [Aquimarina sp. BL5]|uniref:sulfite exporter TauE/SafE family protein n=1 Tax=Aquimarina sp. BL5 TaxID=1714860 RepID=UPI000E4A5879|nr:sulfite exporter TauE/SafE family protein [Aquimarina sp. BL5]AXT51076.1 sulfite exporter TauE/SafE family protein [Aquimarina sp. BL5]RKN02841.1 sulfite exporter TauE/SafE family protein [Aquimarina sp. BL5]
MLLSAFILGLLGSFHCIGMCGPIAFMLPLDHKNHLKKFFQISLYHLGRLLAYSIIGLFFGLVGKSLNIFGMQQGLSISIGVLMILLVLIPSSIFMKYNFSKPVYKVISNVKNALGKELKKKTPDTFLTIGFLNGFLPCGLIYMAVFAAIALGSIMESSMYVLLFGLGTVPLMTAVVYARNLFKGKWIRKHIQKAIPVFVVMMGLLFILRGMGLGIPYVSPKQSTEIVSANFECH